MKPYFLDVNESRIEGRWAKKGNILTQGRPVGYVPEICNYDINLLSGAVMLSLWSQGVADLVVVVVKPLAGEDMVTYLRIKLVTRSKDAKGKGPDMLTKGNQIYGLLSLRDQKTRTLFL